MENQLIINRTVELLNELQEVQNTQAMLFASLMQSFQELLDVQTASLDELLESKADYLDSVAEDRYQQDET